MTDRTCILDECDLPVVARDWCSKHYTRWKRHGDVLAEVRAYTGRQSGACSVDDCDTPAEKRGWCQTHYRRWQRRGDPNSTSKILAPLGGSCENCGSPDLMTRSRRYCSSRCQMADHRSRIPKPPLGINTCLDCGKSFQRATRRGPAAGPRRCDSCTDAYQRERSREDTRRRRARLAQVPVDNFTDCEIFDRDGWVCGICGMPVDPDLRWPDPMSRSLDHIRPIAKGGHHTRDNAQLAHLTCNVRKSATFAEEEGDLPEVS